MPPVLGPSSPSKARLWSCAVPKGSTVLPSQSAKKLASSPSRNSSITAEAPGAEKIASRAASAVARSVATVTPLPAASPSAFTTIGQVVLHAHRRAPRSQSVKRRYSAVGMPASRQRSLVKPLEPSSCAAAFEGPKARDAGRRKVVDEAGDERRLGPDDDEVDLLRAAEGDHRRMVGGVERARIRRRRRCRHCPARQRASSAAARPTAPRRAHARARPIR